MKLPRFRLRTLMVVVAAVALVLAAQLTHRRFKRLSSVYRAKAYEWRKRAEFASLSVEPESRGWLWHRERTPKVRYADAMVEKYEFAADHPWISITPDPPEPK